MPLQMWRDLTPLSKPLRTPQNDSRHILIIGGGVTGLTTAWVLLDRGFRVTVLSKQWASLAGDHITSQIAGALWEYPPAVCGQHEGKVSLEKSKKWSMVSYHCYAALADEVASGVRMRPARFYFPERIENDPVQQRKMEEIVASGVRGFKRLGSGPFKEDLISSNQKIEDCYEHDAPLIDSDQGMLWLMKLVQDKGAKLETKHVRSALLEQEDELLAAYNADIIVNATGLGAEELAADPSCYPVRGALLRVVNDGISFPAIKTAHTVSADVSGASNEIIFIVPRNDHTLLLGGIAEDRVGDTDLTLESDVIQDIQKRCGQFMPCLSKARLHPSYPLAIGLRPFRHGNVRVERETRPKADGKSSRIVHSYGQGGAGWTLAFGCAADVVQLVDGVLADDCEPPRRGAGLAVRSKL